MAIHFFRHLRISILQRKKTAKKMNKKCKISVFTKAGTLMKIMESTIPTLKEGELLVKNEYVTLCRSDISTYTGKRIEKSPTILGHEIVGRIIDFGPSAPLTDLNGNILKQGSRITWAIYASDPNSEMSRRGIPQKSADLFKYGHEQLTEANTLNGGLEEYTIIRRHTPILVLSDSIPLQAAAIINCSVATVAGSLRLAGNIKGSKVAIWGIGMLGIIACAMCREAGAAEIIAIDINKDRLALAERFGATSIKTAGTFDPKELKADYTIDYSGNLNSMADTVDALHIGGTAVWVGGVCPQEPIRLDSEKIIRNLYTIKGLHNYNSDDFQKAVSFMEANHNKYPITELVYDGFDLEHAEEAFQYAIKTNPFRVGIHF